MNRQFLELFRKFMNEQKKRKLWKKAVTVLAGFVVFFTVYALVLPAITMESGNTDAVGITLSGNEIGDEYDDEITVSGNTVPTETPEVPEEPEPELVEPEKIIESEKTIEKVPYKYEDDELAVEVTLPEGSSVPEGAVLRVRTIVDTDDEYEDLAKQAEEAVDGQAEEVVLYDISFYTVENEYIPVAEEATVSFQFKETVFAEAEGEVTVLHYEEEGAAPVELAEVEVQTDENDAVEAVTFQTEGFSVFAVVKVLNTTPVEIAGLKRITGVDITKLDDFAFVLTSINGSYMLSSKAHDTEAGRLASPPTTGMTVGDYIYWTFEVVDDKIPSYKICTGTTYLKVTDTNGLSTTTTAEDAAVFNVTKGGNNEDCLLLSPNENKYINLHGGETSHNGFTVGHETDNGSHIGLYINGTTTVNYVKDLDGKSYAIVSNAENRAISTTKEDSVNGVNGLKPMNVSVKTSGDQKYVIGNEIPEWTFEATDTEGFYHISTTTADGKRYLKLLTTHYDSNKDGRGSLTLETNAQKIAVIKTENDSVYFAAYPDMTGASKTGYINFESYYKNGFWTWNGVNNSSEFLLCEKISDEGILLYDINLPSLSTSYSSKSWATKPYLSNDIQSFDGMSALIGKPEGAYDKLGVAGEKYKEKYPGTADVDNPYYGLYRMSVTIPTNLVNDSYLQDIRGNLNYQEYQFCGWKYLDGSNTYFFEADQEVEKIENGSVVLQGYMMENGKVAEGSSLQSVTIPSGATLNGVWAQVSSPAYFFINHTGTILDTEGAVSANGSHGYLNGVALAWIFYGKQTVGGTGTYALDTDAKISAMFVNQELLDLDTKLPGNEKTQIMIESVINYESGTAKNDPDFAEANAKVITEASLNWIKSKNDLEVHISTGNGKTKVNNEQATADNYSVRWYVVKEQYDGWHIDAVLTAVTKSLMVTKTFAGLNDTQIQNVLENYAIDLRIRGSSEEDIYMTLHTDQYTNKATNWNNGVAGQYEYLGYDSATKTASWSVRLLSEEHVSLTEEGYELSGYVPVCYSVIDGNAETIHEGATTGYQASIMERNNNLDVIGGTNKVVAFSNTYTEEGKASLSILKKDAVTGNVLQGVSFKLKGTTEGITDYEERKTTDISGRTDFMNLKPGTYTLEEIAPPEGYHAYTDKISVVVEAGEIVDDNGTSVQIVPITVTVKTSADEELSTATDYMSIIHTIENQPNPNSLLIRKDFRDIETKEVAAFADDYRIEIKDEDTGDVAYTLGLNDKATEVTAPVYVSSDGLTYQWLFTDVNANKFKVTESNYGCASYIDTVVTAEYIVTSETENKVTEIEPTLNREQKTASVSIETLETAFNQLELVNTYTDEFTLYLRKVDTITQEPLKDAIFSLYGSYEESTKPKETIKYRDSEGNVHTLYYIGETEPSDENGLAQVKGLKLSDDSKAYVYVLSEINAPAGYVKPVYQDNIVPKENVIMVSSSDITNNVKSTYLKNQTQGYDLKVIKDVPLDDLTGEQFYPMTVTIESPTETVRYANREYTYRYYNENDQLIDKDGKVIGSGDEFYDEKGTAPYNSEGSTDISNVDSCSFTVKLKDGWYIIVEDVPLNYVYKVQEVKTNTYYPKMENNNGTGSFNTAKGTIEGVIAEDKTLDDSNVYNTVIVSNYSGVKKEEAKLTVTVEKNWLPADKPGSEAKMQLYRVTNGDLSKAEKYENVIRITATDSWTYEWTGLPLYDQATGNAYDYYVAELPSGYITEYSVNPVNLTVDTEQVAAVHATGATIIVTNTLSYELPQTGSTGTLWYTIGGLALTMTTALMFMTINEKKVRVKK